MMNKRLAQKVLALLISVGTVYGFRSLQTSEGEIVFHQELSWSPDGAQIAFSAIRFSLSDWEKKKWNVFGSSNYDVFLVKADGSGLRRLTDSPGNDLWTSWSPDGSRIVFSSEREGNADLYALTIADSRMTRITAHPAKDSSPAWSPDGSRIAYSSKRDQHSRIFLVDSNGSNEKVIGGPAGNQWSPMWSPDGSKLLYYSDMEGTGKDHIYVANPDGSGGKKLTSTGHNVWPSWSPDGKKILFGRDGNIFFINADGTGERMIIEKAAFARWSPDGSRIAFIAEVSEDRPETRLYVANADGTGRKPLIR